MFRSFVNNIVRIDENITPDSENNYNTPQSKTDEEYFATVDPKTGFKYRIPMLLTTSPTYVADYINYMKLRDQKPEEFERIMGWN